MKTQFITDNNGNKLAVILTMKEYNRIMEDMEELEDIRLYDMAKADNEPSVPIDEAFLIIEEKRIK